MNYVYVYICIYRRVGVCVCARASVCGLICLSVNALPMAGEDVLPSEPRLRWALSPPVFSVIDSRGDIDRRWRQEKAK